MDKSPIPHSRRRLATILRETGDLIHIDDVVAILSIERPKAVQLLSRWTRQAWLRRVGPGTYAPAQLDSLESEQVLDDPWVLIPALYAPAYVGGWTAAEHWGLTEQIFRQTLVMTTRTVREKHQIRHGAQFVLRHIQERKLFGTEPVWRGQSKILISDIHRTIADMLDEPSNGGGIQHTVDCLDAYLKRSDRNDDVLLGYAKKLGNGAIFKRLGFLVEKRSGTANLSEACQASLTTGHAKIDPALECPRLASKWHLRIPASWAPGHAHDH